MLNVLSDAYTAADDGHTALVGLLDLSAAFDTVDQCSKKFSQWRRYTRARQIK